MAESEYHRASAPSEEILSIFDYLNDAGVPFIPTATNGGRHVVGSYHFREGTGGTGLAADVDSTDGKDDSEGLARIFKAFEPVESQLAELIYSGPQVSYNIKNGRRVAKYATSGHHNHVHIAVLRKGIFPHFPGKPDAPVVKEPPRFNPPIAISSPIVDVLESPDGGFWQLGEDGAIYAWAGAHHYGGAFGQPYFLTRKASHLEARADGGYNIISQSQERYQYPKRAR